MAYLLRFTGTGNLKLSSAVTWNTLNFKTKVRLTVPTASGGDQYVTCNMTDSWSYNSGIRFNGTGVLQLGFGRSAGVWTPIATPFAAGTVLEIEYGRNAVERFAVINGVRYTTSLGDISAVNDNLGYIGSYNNNTAYYSGDLFHLSIESNGSTVVSFNSVYHTSNQLTNLISASNPATQFNTWPVDDSEWVFYSSGATYQLTALGGTFTYSGQTAALNRGFKLAAQGGTYSYAGASANLSYTTATIYRLDALGASCSYAGASASLLRGFVLDAQGGAYSYAGASADLSVLGPMVYRLTALGATYVYSGANATLTATGVIPAANPAAFVNRAYVGGRLTNSAKIGGSLTNNATVAI